jgi:hypothetical protein
MVQRKKSLIENFFVSKFPNFEPSIAQRALHHQAMISDTLLVLMSRQVGKTKGCSWIFWDKVINHTQTDSDLYLAVSASEGDIKSFMLNQVFLDAFDININSEEIIINNVYIATPEWWIKKQSKIWASRPDILQTWIEEGLITPDKKFVKLFKDDISVKGKTQHYEGVLFNGAKIMCIACSTHFQNAVRGRRIHGVYGEEIGQWAMNILSETIEPSILSNNGWQIFTGTPNGKNPQNWMYHDLYVPVVKASSTKTSFKAGIDWYVNEIKKEATLTAEEVMELSEDDSIGLTSKRFSTRREVVAVGDIEKLFPYVYKGSQKFDMIQNGRQVPHKVKFLTDENNKPVEDEQSYIVNKRGDIVFKYYKYTIIPTDQKNAGARLNEDSYRKEYRMRFDSGTEAAFYAFNEEANVIPAEKFDPSLYPMRIAGYDHGSYDGIIVTKEDRKKSASAIAKVACIPVHNTYQYIIYETHYLEEANKEDAAREWYAALLEGLPVVVDNALFNKRVVGGQTDFQQILTSVPEVIQDRNRVHAFKTIFGSHKREELEKVNSLNKWFNQSQVEIQGSNGHAEFKNPTDLTKSGRKIMITSNCTELIEYLKMISYEVYGSKKKLKKARNDIWDATTYAIDFVEFDKQKNMEKIKYYWQNHHNYPKLGEPEKPREISYNEYMRRSQPSRHF